MKGMFCLVTAMTGGYAKKKKKPCLLESDGCQLVKLLTACSKVRLNECITTSRHELTTCGSIL